MHLHGNAVFRTILAGGALLSGLLLWPPMLTAQSAHGGHGGSHGSASDKPVLSGEYTFASLAEIVAILDADPSTDWQRVDVAALREHLIDMNRVTVDAHVSSTASSNAIVHTVTADDPRTILAIQRMSDAHARTMADGGISFTVETIDGGARVTVASNDRSELQRLQAIGFLGVLSLGDHHREHHLLIARGDAPH